MNASLLFKSKFNLNSQKIIRNHKMLVQVTTSTFGKAGTKPIEYLESREIPFRVNPYGRKLTEDEAVDVLADADGVIAGTEPLTGKVLKQLPNLKIISRCGTGMNNVDLEAAEELGIKVFNTPTVHVDAVAELALTAALSSLRNVVRNDKTVRSGTWEKTMGRSLYGKKIGIIGFGKVGRKFCELLRPFTSNFFFYDPFLKEGSTQSFNATQMSLENLMETCDILSLHVPYTRENHHMINAGNLSLVKEDVLIINTSRGGLINEDDLFVFLKDHPEALAHLDVFETEPYNGRLKELDNVTLSPHVGTSTRETREEMELEACINLARGFGYE